MKSKLEDDYIDFLRRSGREPYKHNLSVEMLEGIDKQRRVASGAAGFETDLSEEVWSELRGIVDKRGMLFQPVVEMMAREIEECIEPCLKIPKPKALFVGEFPTGSLNALAAPVKHGTLVLVNTGAFYLISKFMRLMTINIFEHHLADDPQAYSAIGISDPSRRFTTGESPLSVADLVEAIARCVFDYVFSGSALGLPRLPILGGLQRASWLNLTFAIEKFMIAHEYGHAVAGHLSKHSISLNARTLGGQRVVKKSWEEEFEADEKGARLVLFKSDNDDPEEKASFEHFAVSGVLLFFELDNLISEVALAFSPEERERIWLDHPPPMRRAENVRKVFSQEGAEEALKSSEELVGWVRGVTSWTTLLAQEVARLHAQGGGGIEDLLDQIIPEFAAAVAEGRQVFDEDTSDTGG